MTGQRYQPSAPSVTIRDLIGFRLRRATMPGRAERTHAGWLPRRRIPSLPNPDRALSASTMAPGSRCCMPRSRSLILAHGVPPLRIRGVTSDDTLVFEMRSTWLGCGSSQAGGAGSSLEALVGPSARSSLPPMAFGPAKGATGREMPRRVACRKARDPDLSFWEGGDLKQLTAVSGRRLVPRRARSGDPWWLIFAWPDVVDLLIGERPRRWLARRRRRRGSRTWPVRNVIEGRTHVASVLHSSSRRRPRSWPS